MSQSSFNPSIEAGYFIFDLKTASLFLKKLDYSNLMSYISTKC